MDICKRFYDMGEYLAAGMYEEPSRSLFYRKALGLRRYFETCELHEYNGEFLYPSGVKQETNLVVPWIGEDVWLKYSKVTDDIKDIADKFISEFRSYKSYVPKEHTVAGNMFTHSFPHYERIIAEGLQSYIPRINKIKDTDMRDGLLHLVEGIDTYAKRCVKYLRSKGADEKLIKALSNVPMQPAGDIYEAIVCWNFVMYLDQCDNPGLLASGLLPYYKGENIVPYLENLYNNLEENDGYSIALHTDYNPLSIQCLEASKGKCRPMVELFVDEDTPDEIWKKAFEVIRSGNGQPAFYNPKLLSSLKGKIPSIKEEDLKRFCGGGCTESMFAGLSSVGSLDAGINLLHILEEVIHTKLCDAKTFDEFYDIYISEVEKASTIVTEAISKSQKERAEFCPYTMRTLLVDDCIDNELDFYNGGARYKWSIVNFAGMINVIDSMLVIRDFVFKNNVMTADELCCLLKNQNEEFFKKARKHLNSFGTDKPDINAFANKISGDIYSTLDGKNPYIGECFLPASIQFKAHAEGGKNIGATPDGRKAGEPLCDSLAAIFGKDTEGPTALLKSVASLRLDMALGTPVLNFNINPDFNYEILKSLILGYFKLGGMQMQITCTSREKLLEAYENPDMHRNLIVRVGGYSDYFHRLDDKMKKMIIDRSIHL